MAGKRNWIVAPRPPPLQWPVVTMAFMRDSVFFCSNDSLNKDLLEEEEGAPVVEIGV